MIIWKRVADAVKAKRAPLAAGHRGMGVRSAAEQIGVSSATVCRVENRKACDADSYMAICRWLGVDPRDFDNGRTK